MVRSDQGRILINDRFGYRREIVDKDEKDKNKDIDDLLPSDSFGMDIDISTTSTAITGWSGDLELEYGDRMRNKGFDRVSKSVVVTKCGESVNEFHVCPDVIGGDPHDAFVLALNYLGTNDLLMVERVCRSLCYTIRNDSLLWRNLYIDQPLNERITDDILVRLTNRAEGNLRFLSLIKCPKITDDGLRRVLETNPKLTKVSNFYIGYWYMLFNIVCNFAYYLY
ncbi:putative F-box domain, leucine-rich repeat domain superfamily, F-box-like domain superfamily [Helianthus annuus]|nr:putative F-box domain, leucine-rich repeat domain superfamily, F-box-like domain superfamily [Helianthus annuus]KAJ0905757.1 putative F-box domain, leucine-rich repeat domain superfamily, F-box-like domain superfamily [Helianthus annuus]KAJ0954936.1 putative F-box domain, leucine-rich repeat domain superfamily, F-box-like domain superfamily [Helianthus annuus]